MFAYKTMQTGGVLKFGGKQFEISSIWDEGKKKVVCGAIYAQEDIKQGLTTESAKKLIEESNMYKTGKLIRMDQIDPALSKGNMERHPAFGTKPGKVHPLLKYFDKDELVYVSDLTKKTLIKIKDFIIDCAKEEKGEMATNKPNYDNLTKQKDHGNLGEKDPKTGITRKQVYARLQELGIAFKITSKLAPLINILRDTAPNDPLFGTPTEAELEAEAKRLNSTAGSS